MPSPAHAPPMARVSRWAGPLFLATILALAATAAADVALTATGWRAGSGADVLAGDERAIIARSVTLHPGDRLVVDPSLPAAPAFVARYAFHVVGEGDRRALLDGAAPRERHLLLADVGAIAAPRPIRWDHPADAPPRHVDLVWVLEYAEGAAPPASEEARSALASSLAASLDEPRGPAVMSARVVAAHSAAGFATAALALLAAAAALAWTIGAADLNRALAPAALRDVLLGAGALIPAVALHVAIGGSLGDLHALLAMADVGVDAWRWAGTALILLYAALSVAWGHALWRAWRAARTTRA